MSIGSKIGQLRKEKGITQEALAKLLDVTNQAVSKWESDQCCPDIQLLPRLADVFDISIDALFDRAPAAERMVEGLPWPKDGTLRVVLYRGHTLLKNSNGEKELVFRYEGPAEEVVSAVSVSCGDVYGDVEAGGNVTCGLVHGDVDAGGSVKCDTVSGDVDAGGSVVCDAVSGDVDAGSSVECGDVGGSVDAGTYVSCGAVDGDVDAGTYVTCGPVKGDVDAGGTVTIQA